MPGNITRLAIREAKFCTLANGNETATLVYIGPLENAVVAFYIRWAWDDNFTALAGYSLEADETTFIKEILVSGNIWNSWAPTWAQLENGGSYIGTDGNTYQGGLAVAARFSDWLRANTPKTIEESTDHQWFHGLFLVELQNYSDQVYVGLVTPPAPPPPMPPAVKFPPNIAGSIQTAMILLEAHASRIISVRDPANGNRPVVACGAVPQ